VFGYEWVRSSVNAFAYVLSLVSMERVLVRSAHCCKSDAQSTGHSIGLCGRSFANVIVYALCDDWSGSKVVNHLEKHFRECEQNGD
jgi:hypothetical protein